IPALLPDIASEHLLAAAVRNYYFPILTGRLIVEVDDREISERTFEEVSRSLPSEIVPRSLLGFVRQLQAAQENEPTFILPSAWQQDGISTETIGSEAVEKLRE